MRAAWDAVLQLRSKYASQDMLLAVTVLAEEHPDVSTALENEVRISLRDQFYSFNVHELEVKQNQVLHADA